jgi:hypothetical protein
LVAQGLADAVFEAADLGGEAGGTTCGARR